MSEHNTGQGFEAQQTDTVLIFDTTLRDGEQSPGIALSFDDKLAIAQQLSRMGVDIIEAGFPKTSPGDFKAVQGIARQVEGPVIAALARGEKGDIDSAYDAVKDASRPRIHTFISTSDIHIEHQLRTDREGVLGMTRASVAQARSLVDDVQFSPMDATRADAEFTAEVLQIAIDEGATTINIPDTVGYTIPEEFAELIEKYYELVPALGSVVLSVHCHDDLGMAVANSIAGIKAGARQVEVAVNGIGERAGNAALEEVVMQLRTRKDRYKVGTNIDTTEIARTSRLVSRLTGYPVPRNKAIVGRNAFEHEAGIHQDGVLKNRNTYEIMDRADIGLSGNGIVLGKHSGRHAVRKALEELDIFDASVFRGVFDRFKSIADTAGAISENLLEEISADAIRRRDSKYTLEYFEAESTPTTKHGLAAIKLPNGQQVTRTVETRVSDSKTPDGPIDALFSAISEATNTDFSLAEYSFVSIDKGTEAVGMAIVSLNVGDKRVTGRAISTDANEASAWAYLDALTKAEDIT
ncbi:MAG: 2-isopropylmalate synthase [Candidatus Saccharimonadales bacterium]